VRRWEYRALRAREYARYRIAEYSSLRFAGVSLRERRCEVFLCSAERYTPICEANDTPGRTRPIFQRSDTPFSAHEFTRKENWQLVFSGFADKNICPFFD